MGIGSIAPTKKLDVAGSMLVSGNVGVGTDTPTASLHVYSANAASMTMQAVAGIGTSPFLGVLRVDTKSTSQGAGVYNIYDTATDKKWYLGLPSNNSGDAHGTYVLAGYATGANEPSIAGVTAVPSKVSDFAAVLMRIPLLSKFESVKLKFAGLSLVFKRNTLAIPKV